MFHAEGFSTMRRFDSTFDTTDPHEAFKPPVDDAAADAPAEPGTEREGAAPDEASSDPYGFLRLQKDYAAAASGLASWHSSQDAASAALRAKHRLQRHPTAGRVKRNGRVAFSPKLSGAGRGA